MYTVIAAVIILVIVVVIGVVVQRRRAVGAPASLLAGDSADSLVMNHCNQASQALSEDVYLQRLLMVELLNGGTLGAKATYDKILQNNEALASSLVPMVGLSASHRLNELWDQKAEASLQLYFLLCKDKAEGRAVFGKLEEVSGCRYGSSCHKGQKLREACNSAGCKEELSEWIKRSQDVDRAVAEVLARSEGMDSTLSSASLTKLSAQYNRELASQVEKLAEGKFDLSLKHLEGARNIRKTYIRRLVDHMWNRLVPRKAARETAGVRSQI